VTSTPIRIVIVDDHSVVRHGVRALLETEVDFQVIGEAASGEEAVAQCKELAPDVVVMDLVLPGINGAEAARLIRLDRPECRILILTSYHQDEFLFPAIQAGVESYLLKDVHARELIDAIRRTASGEAVLPPAIAQRVMRALRAGAKQQAASGPEKLTERESEVLHQLAEGLSNLDIAEKLFISEKTVKTHVSNVLGKLGVADRTQAAVYAWRERLMKVQEGN
jgi:NarL family two-component system response regulator LiaR